MFGAAAAAVLAHLPHVVGTYRLFVSNTFVPATGVQTPTYYNVTGINMAQEPLDVKEIAPNGAGPVQLGDVAFLFPYIKVSGSFSQAQSGGLSTSDLVVVGSVTYRVIMIGNQGSNTMLRIVARRQA